MSIIGGMAQVTPYAGGGRMFAHVNSYVIDETPHLVTYPDDQSGGPGGSLYNFPTLDWQDNGYWRFVGGLRINVAMIELLYELNMGKLRGGRQMPVHSIKLGFDV